MDAGKVEGHVIISEGLATPGFIRSSVYLSKGVYYDKDPRKGGRKIESGILRRGRILHDSKNVITTDGDVRLSELISGLSVDWPDRIAVGDGGLESGGDSPLIPSKAQSALAHEVARQAVVQRVLSVDGIKSITFISIFRASGSYQFAQPGQSQISEIGLFCRDDVMTSVHNYAPIPVDLHRLGVMAEWQYAIL